jgi:hypothetical protein
MPTTGAAVHTTTRLVVALRAMAPPYDALRTGRTPSQPLARSLSRRTGRTKVRARGFVPWQRTPAVQSRRAAGTRRILKADRSGAKDPLSAREIAAYLAHTLRGSVSGVVSVANERCGSGNPIKARSSPLRCRVLSPRSVPRTVAALASAAGRLQIGLFKAFPLALDMPESVIPPLQGGAPSCQAQFDLQALCGRHDEFGQRPGCCREVLCDASETTELADLQVLLRE